MCRGNPDKRQGVCRRQENEWGGGGAESVRQEMDSEKQVKSDHQCTAILAREEGKRTIDSVRSA
jgi:hypothetical protein